MRPEKIFFLPCLATVNRPTLKRSWTHHPTSNHVGRQPVLVRGEKHLASDAWLGPHELFSGYLPLDFLV